MPLPFSFSTQRQSSAAEMPAATTDITVAEMVMNHAPEHVMTEPLFGTPGKTFSPPVFDVAHRGNPDVSRLRPSQFPPASSPNLRFADGQETSGAVDYSAAGSVDSIARHDWAAQIEQMRNDVFGIAMSVSALNDRLDRLEQRTPPGGQSVQAGIASLRSEIETWLETHLNSAVEHCMYRLASRNSPTATHPAS